MTMRFLLAAAVSLSTGCREVPPLPPETTPGDCASAEANLSKLGGCGQDMATFRARCERVTASQAETGKRFAAGCLSNAASCATARACK